MTFLSSYQTVEKSSLPGKTLRCCEKTIPLLSRGYLLDLVEGEPSKKMDLSPEGRGHAQRRHPLLSGLDQACSEILVCEFSIFVQVCREGVRYWDLVQHMFSGKPRTFQDCGERANVIFLSF